MIRQLDAERMDLEKREVWCLVMLVVAVQSSSVIRSKTAFFGTKACHKNFTDLADVATSAEICRGQYLEYVRAS